MDLLDISLGNMDIYALDLVETAVVEVAEIQPVSTSCAPSETAESLSLQLFDNNVTDQRAFSTNNIEQVSVVLR